jgi:hypothetical protein
MSSSNHARYDLATRLYKITEFIQKTAVKRCVSVVQIREELTEHCQISKALLSLLENAQKGTKRPIKLQLIQEMRMNEYFRKHLKTEEIFVMQLALELG